MTLQDGRLILPWPGRVLRSKEVRLRLTPFSPSLATRVYLDIRTVETARQQELKTEEAERKRFLRRKRFPYLGAAGKFVVSIEERSFALHSPMAVGGGLLYPNVPAR